MVSSSLRMACAVLGVVWAAPALAANEAPAVDAASVARGQRLFLRCISCHDVAGVAVEKNGPTLKGVFGRAVAAVPGYGYSKSLAGQSFKWDAARLDEWLIRPAAIAPGTTMAFEGMPQAADRKALIDYLREQR